MRGPVLKIELQTLRVEVVEKVRFKCIENCGKCCERLEIPLRDEDIERLVEAGYDESYFVDETKMFYRGSKFLGYALKKRPFDDACVFLDPETKRCRVYKHRPLACRLYPFVFVKKNKIIEVYISEECPGIGHPKGKIVNGDFILREYGDIFRDLR